MMYHYDKPEYTFDDPDLVALGDDVSAIRTVRFLKTYVDFVEQRYGDCLRIFPHYQKKEWYGALSSLLDGLGDRDPAHFTAFIFEIWERREYYAQFQHLWGKDMAGFSYPSIKHIWKKGHELLAQFLVVQDYKPKEFVPFSDVVQRDKRIMERQVERWCACYDKTVRDYWLTPEHLFPPHLTADWIDAAESLWEMNDEIEATFGFSVEELKAGLPKLERMQWRGVETRSMSNEELFWHNTTMLDRIELTEHALKEGVDVTTDEFQEVLERVLRDG